MKLEDRLRPNLENRNTTYISCWNRNNYESEAMWKLYSKDVTTNAIAIQTTVGDTKSLNAISKASGLICECC